MAREPLERPGERAGGRLVAGGEQRHDLVAQLVLGRAGGDQLVEHRGPAAGRAGADRGAQQRVDARDRGEERAPRRRAARRERERDQPRERRRHVERAADRLRAAAGRARRARRAGSRPASAPASAAACAAAARGPSARPRPPPSAATVARCSSIRLPWNGGSTSLRWRRCCAPLVSRIELGPANGSSTVELAPPRSASGRRGVDALDRLGVGDEHHRRVGPQRPQRERLAVARGAAAQQVGRPRDPLDRLQRRRRGGPGREHVRAYAGTGFGPRL